MLRFGEENDGEESVGFYLSASFLFAGPVLA